MNELMMLVFSADVRNTSVSLAIAFWFLRCPSLLMRRVKPRPSYALEVYAAAFNRAACLATGVAAQPACT